VWARVAAKECARRLWLERGEPPVFPADLTIEFDVSGRPHIRSLLEPGRDDLSTISIGCADGVAVALGSLDPEACVGISIATIAESEPDFGATGLTNDERVWLDRHASSIADRAEWTARLLCAKHAAAKAAVGAVSEDKAIAQVIDADVTSGEVLVTMAADFGGASAENEATTMRVFTARRGTRAWAWTFAKTRSESV
jgi:hypothetical protein